jgi:S-methylmethionine-dependent homocysteine/selenocysteine methylase
MAAITILDGPLGTELAARGVPTPLPGWSAHALDTAPDVVRAIHADYAAAGATLHTANTFRTTERVLGERWTELARRAVLLAREALPAGARLAGSIAPLADCYRPDLSPAEPRAEHRALARELAAAGSDLLLCETFPHAGEARVAVEEAVATGLPTWVAFTAGPDADLMTPDAMRAAARDAILAGASAVLVNCVGTAHIGAYVEALAGLGVPFGAYANAGVVDPVMGWRAAREDPTRYAERAAAWVAAGATLVGSCCGTGPPHTAALAARFGGRA